jgi:hypothetical protein
MSSDRVGGAIGRAWAAGRLVPAVRRNGAMSLAAGVEAF